MQASVISLRCRYQTQHPGIRVAPCPVWQSSTIPIVKFNQQNLAAQQSTHRNINHITLATLGANHRQFRLLTSINKILLNHHQQLNPNQHIIGDHHHHPTHRNMNYIRSHPNHQQINTNCSHHSSGYL